MKYRILARPKTYDTALYEDEFDNVDDAVRFAMDMACGSNFLVIQIIDWKAEPNGDKR